MSFGVGSHCARPSTPLLLVRAWVLIADRSAHAWVYIKKKHTHRERERESHQFLCVFSLCRSHCRQYFFPAMRLAILLPLTSRTGKSPSELSTQLQQLMADADPASVCAVFGIVSASYYPQRCFSSHPGFIANDKQMLRGSGGTTALDILCRYLY